MIFSAEIDGVPSWQLIFPETCPEGRQLKTQTRRPWKTGGQWRPGQQIAVQPGRGKHQVGRVEIVCVRAGIGISTYDAVAEGFVFDANPAERFLDLWDKMYNGEHRRKVVLYFKPVILDIAMAKALGAKMKEDDDGE